MYRALLFREALFLGKMAFAVSAMVTGHAGRQLMPSMPEITADPMDFLDQIQLLQRRELQQRQEVSSPFDLTVTNAPDATCGYLSAEIGVPITCTNKEVCAWALVQEDAGVIRCGTEIKVNCYESFKAVDPTLCNDVCQSDTMNLLCTDSDMPYCRTYAFPNGIRDYRCASSSLTAEQSAEHTFYGQKNPKFTTRVANGAGATTELEEAADKAATKTDEPTTITKVAESTKSTSNDGSNKSSSAPIGAIVGGAVGGVALIGLVMLGIFFVLRRKRNKTVTTQGPINPPVMNFIPQNMGPSMLDSKMVASPHTQPGSAISPLQSDGRQSMFGPPPVYEAPGHESQVHEMGDSSERK
ncbi:hypothetical protein FVEN_g9753 [Fusarium venenatum]|uniref:Mid2 domain-containing protein n=1 Tax=Fusarium venenatum TaxID=56646 RepID=A0A2L2U5M1_9HYPO|nr:uncharacterized protein FVRRES_10942 [Fusarium venenatum]KAG8352246.1 hypothetical protein FVEN_g9753 [Fusarium venenatum]KAH6967510.1 hypothetical protein EDB82DRAFT_563326 [Fusarium venenatum]CEI70865.1 unnamed protein product [Fusarium venenatum]